MEEATNTTGEPKKYRETVKGTILGAIADGTSVLLKNRKGIDYSMNAASGTVYSDVNQLYLQQIRENNGFKNPHWMTINQAGERGMRIVRGSHGSVINYFSRQLRYRNDVYPLGPDDTEDMKKAPIHRKGDLKVDRETGQPLSGYEYNNVFNLEQIDTRQHHYRETFDKKTGTLSGNVSVVSQAFKANDDYKLALPFENTIKAGAHYTARDDSPLEKFQEAVSKYLNSIYTGQSYKGAYFTPEEAKELQAEITDVKSTFFSRIVDASFIATGRTDKLDRVQKIRDEKTRTNETGRKMERKSSKSRSR